MVRPRLENLARWVVLVCSASRLTISESTVRQKVSLPPSLLPAVLEGGGALAALDGLVHH